MELDQNTVSGQESQDLSEKTLQWTALYQGRRPDQSSAMLTTCIIRIRAAVHGLSSADFGSAQHHSGRSEFV